MRNIIILIIIIELKTCEAAIISSITESSLSKLSINLISQHIKSLPPQK